MVKKTTKEKKIPAVNVHDQQEMINLGLHPKYRELYIFQKSKKEKEELKKLRRKLGRGFYNQKWMNHSKPYIPVYDKLILYIKGESTKSIQCNQADIPEILVRLAFDNKEVLKYQWNGRTYSANEKPFYKTRIKGGKSVSVRSYAA